MTKPLAETAIARCRRDRYPVKIASWLALIGLLLIAGCTAGANSSNEDKNNGFYGGVTGGANRP
jgi:hypothetical protein